MPERRACPKKPMMNALCKGISGEPRKRRRVKIATDMITLAWEDTYDIGVLVSADL